MYNVSTSTERTENFEFENFTQIIDLNFIQDILVQRDFSDELSTLEKGRILAKYQKLKERNQISHFFDLLRICGNIATIEKVMNFLKNTEEQEHGCIYKYVFECITDPELKAWVLDNLKQGFGYKLNKKFRIYCPLLSKRFDWLESYVVPLVSGTYTILSVHLDTYKDIVIFLALQHFCTQILVRSNSTFL